MEGYADLLKVLGELVRQLGVPALVIIFYMVKEWKQGDKIVEAMKAMVAQSTLMVNSNAQIVTAVQEVNRNATAVSKDISEMKVRVEMISKNTP